ncbi:MAG: uroporphyrinogen decarboxylase family protein [Candidatus Hydrogenedentes bacterium]|nr:uroporphyrinogen decarboxylase family protein [Candidatus Hydrogenedentota bacterium]
MNSRERLYNRMAGKPVDRVPVVPIFMAWAAEYAGYTYGRYQQDYRAFADSMLRVLDRFEIDQATTLSDPHRETADYGADVCFVDDGVCRCRAPLLQEYGDIRKLRRMPIEETTRMLDRVRGIERFNAERGGDISILGWVEGPLAEYCTLRTLEAAMTDLLTEPRFFHDVCAITMDNAIAWSRAQIEAGADMIGVGDAASSLVSVDMFREHVLPWHQRLFGGIHAAGAKVRLHICGNIAHLLPAIHDSGADIVDIDWMVDLRQARQALGAGITLFGHFDPAAVLKMGTPEDVAAHARADIAAGGDRFALMPGCEVPPGTSEANIAAFCPGEGCLIRDALES